MPWYLTDLFYPDNCNLHLTEKETTLVAHSDFLFIIFRLLCLLLHIPYQLYAVVQPSIFSQCIPATRHREISY